MALRDIGRAKLNLTLEVLGRRADGYHELRSLVAFAGPRRRDHASSRALRSTWRSKGRSLKRLSGDNLVVRAAEAASVSAPGVKLGRFRLVKQLPVAAGLGGGSADAAAALRLIAQRQSRRAERSGDGRDCRPPRLRRHGLSGEPAGADDRARRERWSPCAAFRLAACCSPIRAFRSRPPPSMPSFAPTICARRRLVGERPPDFHGDFEQLLAYALPRLQRSRSAGRAACA